MLLVCDILRQSVRQFVADVAEVVEVLDDTTIYIS